MKKIINSRKNLNKLIPCLLFALIIIGVFSCKKDEDIDKPFDCGCDSETLFTIPNEELQIPIEEQKSGLLFYKHPEDIDDFYNYEEYNNRFWIFQGIEGCYNCQRHYIVCNEELLGTAYDYLRQGDVHDSIPVQFSGNAKRTCNGPIILPADYSYNEIILSSIENQ